MDGRAVGGFQYHVKRLSLQTFPCADDGVLRACLLYGVALPCIGYARRPVVIDVLRTRV